MVIKKQYLGFWCKFCDSVHYVEDLEYKETDDFYEYRLICPGCGKSLTFRQQSIMSYIRECKQIKG